MLLSELFIFPSNKFHKSVYKNENKRNILLITGLLNVHRPVPGHIAHGFLKLYTTCVI